MTHDEKQKACVIPSVELRQVNCSAGGQATMIKIQQKHYNHEGTAFVWRDIESIYSDYRKFSEKYSFE